MNALVAVVLALTLRGSSEPPCAGMPTNTPHARAAVVRCVARYHGVNPAKAVRVARCESYPEIRARLVSNGNYGAFQLRFWHERWLRWGKRLGVPNNPLSLLANAHVALAMVADYGGWSHWSCGDR